MEAKHTVPLHSRTRHQTWGGSLRETIWNFGLSTAIGSVVWWLAVAPIARHLAVDPAAAMPAFIITAYYTMISMVRRYAIRRWHGKHEQSKRASRIEAYVTTAICFAAAWGLTMFIVPLMPFDHLDPSAATAVRVNLVITGCMMVVSLAIRRGSVAVARRRAAQ